MAVTWKSNGPLFTSTVQARPDKDFHLPHRKVPLHDNQSPTSSCLLSTCESKLLCDVCRYTLDGVPANAKQISMIAGGTGITPMYQVIKAVLKNPDDDTQLSLLYANQSPDDILLFEELLEMAKDSRLKVWYTGKTSALNPHSACRSY